MLMFNTDINKTSNTLLIKNETDCEPMCRIYMIDTSRVDQRNVTLRLTSKAL